LMRFRCLQPRPVAGPLRPPLGTVKLGVTPRTETRVSLTASSAGVLSVGVPPPSIARRCLLTLQAVPPLRPVFFLRQQLGLVPAHSTVGDTSSGCARRGPPSRLIPPGPTYLEGRPRPRASPKGPPPPRPIPGLETLAWVSRDLPSFDRRKRIPRAGFFGFSQLIPLVPSFSHPPLPTVSPPHRRRKPWPEWMLHFWVPPESIVHSCLRSSNPDPPAMGYRKRSFCCAGVARTRAVPVTNSPPPRALCRRSTGHHRIGRSPSLSLNHERARRLVDAGAAPLLAERFRWTSVRTTPGRTAPTPWAQTPYTETSVVPGRASG